MKEYILIQSKENFNSNSGNYLAGKILRAAKPKQHFKGFQNRRKDAISDCDIIMAFIGQLCNGRNDFNDIELYKDDMLFKDSYGLNSIPSEATLRQRLDELPQNKTETAIRKFNTKLLSKSKITGIELNDSHDLIPVDIDVSPFDNSNSKKECIGMTYKKIKGYAPLFVYVGKEGFMLDCELRPGSQHSQEGTPEVIRRSLKSLSELGLSQRCLFRMDAAHDAAENIELLKDERFIIKRNLRKESLDYWHDIAKTHGREIEDADGKKIYVGSLHHLCPGKDKTNSKVPVIFKVSVRYREPNGQGLLFEEVQVDTWWSNLPVDEEEVIRLYEDHATSEQFHSELKSDMGIERLPSGRFSVNKLVLLMSMISYNVLRTIGQEVISRANKAPKSIRVNRWRIRTVLQNVMYLAAKIVRHANRMALNFGGTCKWFVVIRDIAKAFT